MRRSSQSPLVLNPPPTVGLPPSPPLAEASAVSGSSARVAWEAVQDGGLDVSSYDVQCRGDATYALCWLNPVARCVGTFRMMPRLGGARFGRKLRLIPWGCWAVGAAAVWVFEVCSEAAPDWVAALVYFPAASGSRRRRWRGMIWRLLYIPCGQEILTGDTANFLKYTT